MDTNLGVLEVLLYIFEENIMSTSKIWWATRSLSGFFFFISCYFLVGTGTAVIRRSILTIHSSFYSLRVYNGTIILADSWFAVDRCRASGLVTVMGRNTCLQWNFPIMWFWFFVIFVVGRYEYCQGCCWSYPKDFWWPNWRVYFRVTSP